MLYNVYLEGDEGGIFYRRLHILLFSYFNTNFFLDYHRLGNIELSVKSKEADKTADRKKNLAGKGTSMTSALTGQGILSN